MTWQPIFVSPVPTYSPCTLKSAGRLGSAGSVQTPFSGAVRQVESISSTASSAAVPSAAGQDGRQIRMVFSPGECGSGEGVIADDDTGARHGLQHIPGTKLSER